MFFDRMDDFLIDRVFQKVSDWISDVTGRSNFWVACVCIWLSILGWMVSALYTYQFLNSKLWIMDISIAFGGVFAAQNLRDLDDRWELSANHVVNTRRLTYFSLRCLGVCCLVLYTPVLLLVMVLGKQFAWEVLATTFAVWMMVTGEYFAACTPRPPQVMRQVRSVHVEA